MQISAVPSFTESCRHQDRLGDRPLPLHLQGVDTAGHMQTDFNIQLILVLLTQQGNTSLNVSVKLLNESCHSDVYVCQHQ